MKSQKKKSFILKFLRGRTLRKYISLGAVILVAVAISLFGHLGSAQAFATYSQTNWSGGVGDDPQAGQYAGMQGLDTSVSGELSFGSGGQITNWCQTSACSTAWTRRKSVQIRNFFNVNTGIPYSDAVIDLTVGYELGMKSDFSDLRFVSVDGTTDLGFYVAQKTNSSVAHVQIRVPAVADQLALYMYYGNSGASSASNINSIATFRDNFYNYSTTAAPQGITAISGRGMTRDASQRLYIVNATFDMAYQYSTDGTLLQTFGYPGSGAGQLVDPIDIGVDPTDGAVFVLDRVGRIVIFNSDGSPRGDIIDGTQPSGGGALSSPSGMAMRSDGLWVADSGNHLIRKFNPANGVQTASIGGYGSDLSHFDTPVDIAYAADSLSGHLYVLDSGNSRVLRFDDDLQNPTLVIDGADNGGGSNEGEFDQASALSVDRLETTIYIAETDNNRVEMFNVNGGRQASWYVQAATGLSVDQSGFISVSNPFTTTTYRQPGIDPTIFSYVIPENYSISGDKVTISEDPVDYVGLHTIGGTPVQDRSKTRTYEVDIRVDGEHTCDFIDPFSIKISPNVFLNANGSQNNCTNWDGIGRYRLGGIDDGAGFAGGAFTNSPDFEIGQTVRLRLTVLIGSSSEYSYSTDGGLTFTAFEGPPDASTEQSIITMTAFRRPLTLSHFVAFDGTPKSVQTSLGHEESVGGYTGYVLSPVINLGSEPTFGDISISSVGSGRAGLYMRTDQTTFDNPEDDFYFCGLLRDGDAVDDTQCTSGNSGQYVQYMLVMSGDINFKVTDVSFEYSIADIIPPSGVTNLVAQAGSSGPVIPTDGWVNATQEAPHFSWSSATDDADGEGVRGYCLYLGSDNTADPATTSGLLLDFNQGSYTGIQPNGACQHMTDQLSYDVPSDLLQSSNTVLYFRVMAVDNAGNVQSSPLPQASFRVDKDFPAAYTAISGPGVTNTKTFSINFIGGAPAYFADNTSGIAGFKYCITQDLGATGPNSCQLDGTQWYGVGHTGDGRSNSLNGASPLSTGGFTTVLADYERIQNNYSNFVFLAAIDQAGNPSYIVSTPAQLPFTAVTVTSYAPSAPLSLVASPTSNTSNTFSFTWAKPETYLGLESVINYCYSVNDPIASDGSNCTWTGQNITQLASGPYATQQGVNTLYLMAKDQTGNFSSANYASVTFTAATTAPGAPQSLDVSDVSVRTSSSWKLAMSWAAPSQSGSGIASYRIYRSTDGTTFSQVGTTSSSNLSFIDTGLSQVLYSYQVKACDNAGNCGLASNTDSRLPTGRFTSAATLTTQPSAVNITTRKATIQWQTDRESDSKVALGTSPGSYGAEETGNSTQATSHTVNLTSLQPGTRYYYVAKWTDQDGNTGTSSEGSFTTAAAPVVGEVRADSLTVDGATVRFTTTGASQAILSYGRSSSFGGTKEINTSTAQSNYTIVLSDLEDDTKYFYKVTTRDADGNVYDGDTYTLTTSPRPRISQLRFTSVADAPRSTQKVTWKTNIPASSEISYGLLNGSTTDLSDSRLKTEHELIIEGLVDGSQYVLVARSRNDVGDTATSDKNSFRTALDTRAPKISDVVVETAIRGSGADARGQLTIAWKTDEPSTSQVAFGPGQSGEYTGRTTLDSRLTTDHVVVISDLPTSSIYRLQVVSRDAAGNVGTDSSMPSVIVGRGVENIFNIIFETIQRIFGL